MTAKKSGHEVSIPLDQVGVNLYQSEAKVYPRSVQGNFARLRWLAVWILLGLFYLLPWLKIKGEQAVLFDLPARKFTIFGMHLWPQDFYLLALLLIICALGLFFVTALAGRIWCGYACPQTVWTELFMLVERWIEGDRAKRMKLDAAPWTANKIARKTGKQSAWIVMGLFTGFTFVAYFTPLEKLWQNLLNLSLGPWETFWILFYGFATYGNAGFLREQVCKYMCPYARFQSAMFDQDSLIVAYDEKRGEPRGSRKRGSDYQANGLGACIDCTMCVQVCPTGIDIRDGLQYECIACAACVDVCDSVMDKMGYERGLIRYTSENALAGKKSRIFRLRTIIYGLLLGAICTAWVFLLINRQDLNVDLERDRNSLYQVLDDRQIENVYTLRLVNKSMQARNIIINIEPMEYFSMSQSKLYLQPEAISQVPLRIKANQDELTSSIQTIKLILRDAETGNKLHTIENKFISPGK
ncbi:MAG: cytochrome c oxidase accessory protein CcoG [Gammaproteobacteria bacterium]|nr:cytochrome c oxidase accessory protein CcoG [Gammaproteobacteria bacterium]NNC98179.1 cytochrome c oxidase accessory protein CcoG [Gammaproteobacteria bacterium]NNM14873.1 cytochrome c oxidase accessory protein CcoG [Gammaproteobacteria bacterium]